MRHATFAVTCAVRCKASACEVALASCACRLSTTTRLMKPSRCWRAVGTASAALLSPDEYATDSLTCLRACVIASATCRHSRSCLDNTHRPRVLHTQTHLRSSRTSSGMLAEKGAESGSWSGPTAAPSHLNGSASTWTSSACVCKTRCSQRSCRGAGRAQATLRITNRSLPRLQAA